MSPAYVPSPWGPARRALCAALPWLFLAGCDASALPPEAGSLFVTEVTPPLGPRAGGLPVTLRGRGFAPNSAVYFGDTRASDISVTSENELHLRLPAFSGALGPVAVSVVNDDQRRAFLPDLFTYYALDFAADPQPLASNQPHALAACDLDRDGAADLVVARQNPPGISVLLSGGGTSHILEQPVGTQPNALAVADISGDGLPDLLVAEANHLELWFLLGRSDGTLTAGAPVPTGCAVNSLHSADLDGDGRTDILIGCREEAQSAYWLKNQYGPGGVAAFSSPQPLAGLAGPLAVTSADFDGDGRRDIATVSSRRSQRQLFLNQGSGRFVASPAQASGSAPTSLFALDVNRDGRLDLLTADSGATSLGVALGDGAGHFTAASAVELGHAPGQLATLDWNGDGQLDLAVSDPQRPGIELLLADGSGRFAISNRLDTDGPNANLLAYFAAADQRSYLATSVPASSRLRVFHRDANDGLGGRLGAAEALYATLPAPHAPVASDFTSDGRVDVAWIEGARITLLAATGDGTFEPPITLSPAATPRGFVGGDWNGDQLADFAVTRSDGLSIFLSRGPGQTQAPFDMPLPLAPTLILAADVNQDNRPDLITASSQATLQVLLANGNGTFAPPLAVEMSGVASALSVADLDADGVRDLLVMTATGVSWRRGLGGGQFGELAGFSIGQALSAMVSVDVNFDGMRDLLLADAATHEVHLLVGQGGGALRLAQSIAVESSGASGLSGLAGRYLVALDLDRDGNIDLALAEEGRSAVQVLLGKRDGTLQPPIEFPTALPASGLVALDLDGDRFGDLVVTSALGYSVLRNSAQR